jgi:platelet-activating factor acetylhydrolase
MLFLSEIQGRFTVGAITFVTPVRPDRTVGPAKLRNSTAKPPEPAFCLQEVAFTAYYPAELSSKTTTKGIHWLIRLVELLVIQPSSQLRSN